MNPFARLFGAGRREDADADLDAALARAAARVEPRLPGTRGWPGRYRRAIAAALAQARRVAKDVPGPLALSPARYAADPRVRALFGSAADIRRVLCGSQAVRDYVASPAAAADMYALLSMRLRERQVLGVEIAGDQVRREVAQTQVWFSDHRLSGPAPSEAEARRALLWFLFDRFLERLAVGVERLRAERERLAREKDLAMARLRGGAPSGVAHAHAELESILKRLGDVNRCLELERMDEVFEAVLSHPEDCLYLAERRLALDPLGNLRPGVGGADVLHFAELHERYQDARVVVLVHCPEVTPVSAGERLREAEGWL